MKVLQIDLIYQFYKLNISKFKFNLIYINLYSIFLK